MRFSHTCISGCCSLDGDHAFGIKRSAKPLPEGVWTHVAINVSFEQRVLEVLVDGMVDTQQPLPPTKGFFVNGKMVPLLVGDPSGKVEPGARLAGFHVALVQVRSPGHPKSTHQPGCCV